MIVSYITTIFCKININDKMVDRFRHVVFINISLSLFFITFLQILCKMYLKKQLVYNHSKDICLSFCTIRWYCLTILLVGKSLLTMQSWSCLKNLHSFYSKISQNISFHIIWTYDCVCCHVLNIVINFILRKQSY